AGDDVADDLRAVRAARRVEQLVHVVGERVGRVRALVDAHEVVARDAERAFRARERDVVGVVDLVADVILLALDRAGVVLERLRRLAERDPRGLLLPGRGEVLRDPLVDVRAARVAPVLVAERALAAGRGVDDGRRMPGRIDLAVGPDDRV